MARTLDQSRVKLAIMALLALNGPLWLLRFNTLAILTLPVAGFRAGGAESGNNGNNGVISGSGLA